MKRKLDLVIGQVITMTPTVANWLVCRNAGLELERIGITQYRVVRLP